MGVVEAKPTGTTLSGVAEQTTKYLASVPANVPRFNFPFLLLMKAPGWKPFSGICETLNPAPAGSLPSISLKP